MIKDVVICRCEEVMLREIITSIEGGTKTAKALKLKTRGGMGSTTELVVVLSYRINCVVHLI